MSWQEEDRPKPPVTHQIGQDLSTLSVDELDERTALLQAEVARLQEARAKKLASRDAAASFFKS